MEKRIFRKEKFGGILFNRETGKCVYMNKKEAAEILYNIDDLQIIKNPIIKNCFLSAPETIGIDITQQCNLHCMHCYKESGEKQNNELTTAEIYSIIDQCFEFGILFLFISGGEATCRPDIFRIIQYANTKKIKIVLSTHGVYDRKILDKIITTHPYQVRISIDGNEEINDRIRGTGTFKKALFSVRFLKKHNIDVRITCHLCKANISCIEEIFSLAMQLSVIVKFSTIRPIGKALNLQQMKYLSNLEFFSGIKKILDIEKRINHTVFYSDFKNVIAEEPLIEIPGYKNDSCFAAQNTFTIACNGDVFPCSFFTPFKQFKAGNIKKDTIINIWRNSRILNKFRNKNNPVKCRYCRFYRVYCNGGCPAMAYTVNGDIEATDPLCPEYFCYKKNRY